MKVLGKFLLRVLLIALVIFLMISLIRWVNWRRYKDQLPSDQTSSTYNNPTDLSRYQTSIDEVNVDRINQDAIQGFHLLPEDKTSQGVVVTFGGSEGSPDYDRAIQIAQAGYEVYALFYFGMPKQPQTLAEVPLDFFGDFLELIDEDQPLTLVGSSKGAELALNLATIYPDAIDQVVAFAPTSHSFFALDTKNMKQSSWAYQGKPLPYLKQTVASFSSFIKMISGFVFLTPVHFTATYASVLERSAVEDLEASRIKVEDYSGEILLFAGGDDQMWPSKAMAKDLANHNDRIQLEIYPEAGHLFYNPGDIIGNQSSLLAVGGSSEANQAAAEASEKLLMEKLAEWHGE
ncbi:alpha/beta fold hydrolase [Aerococcus kribbianus]|uniref:Alpha/beta hydrolase n=1 Tax=Aerococcus kribbianus TaxID=2999064 RepID=A0A9X3FNG4_9LACT|nr:MULTISPECIES: alpha/beta fold hydrolase [unclassified Aerococcus]MCZ0716821.1 alpha/beta hydrolase [Aerococcus sp. YH-aer221]MCZ0725109.1 alpha/beta hydrolase [Aerococcus sp. YH-aer222]